MSAKASFAVPDNPFPGLRPFREDEEYLFFGRENQIDAMVDKLAATRFLSVVGGSGSGKSSMVNCGLRPALHGGLMPHAGTSWRMAQFRPGSDPLKAMAEALSEDGVLFSDHQAAGGLSLTEIVDTTLRMSKLGLIDIYEQANLGENVNLLVVVDQFEELFRYRELGAAAEDNPFGVNEEDSAFVNLLLEAKNQTRCPIYVVLTMRSDFLGDCAHFPGLVEAVNAGQYLVPRMTRDERRAAITGPAGVGGAEISPVLLTRLVNDVGDNPDQLSILQHALNRTWACRQHESREDGPLDLPHYEAIGTMAHALDQHAEKAYSELRTSRQQEICEKIFKALTDKATDPRGVRRPTTLANLCALSGAAPSEVKEVIEVFRRPSRSFLMPPGGIELKRETVIDISHESLMRVWERLKTWAEEEAKSAAIYRRLAETSVLYRREQAGLWKNPDLQLALKWFEHNRPNEVWAQRYHPEFTSAVDFLKRSRTAYRRRRWTLLGSTFLVFAVLTGALVFVWTWAITIQHFLYDASVFIAQREIQEGKNEHARTLLERYIAPRLSYLRGFEWYYVWRQLPEDKGMLTGHSGTMLSVAFSPDGKILATGSGDDNVKLWNVATQEHVATLAGHSNSVVSVAFTPDGKTLASASLDSSVKLWDVATYEELAMPAGHSDAVYSVAFSPDGKILATGSRDNTVKLWNVATREQVATLTGHSDAVYSLAFSPDGKMLATGDENNSLKLWSMLTHKELATMTGHSNSVVSVAFSPDGSTLATASYDKSVKLWDVLTNKELATLSGHAGSVSSVAFSPDGKILATGSGDNTTKLWDVATRKELATLTGHSGSVSSVAFAPDGVTLVTGSEDKSLKLWDVATYKELVKHTGRATLTGHTNSVLSVAFSPDGKTLATGSADRSVKFWDLATQQVLATLTGHSGTVQSIAFSPDGKMLATGSGDKTVKLWDVATHRELATLKGHEKWVSSVAFSPDGKTLATSSADRTLRLWDMATQKELGTLTGHLDTVQSVAFSPDGKTLATGSEDNRTRLWDVATRKELATLTGHTDSVYSVAFSPDGKTLVTGSADNSVLVWDVATHKHLEPLVGHSGTVYSLAFSPDGRTLATGSTDNTAKLWDMGSYIGMVTLTGHLSSLQSVAFSPDGKTLATASEDMTLRLWFAATDEEVAAQINK